MKNLDWWIIPSILAVSPFFWMFFRSRISKKYKNMYGGGIYKEIEIIIVFAICWISAIVYLLSQAV